jgi:hypothetical protein
MPRSSCCERHRRSRALSAEENATGQAVLDRIVAMLTRLGRRGYVVREASAGYAAGGIDTDGDSDTDPEGAGRVGKVPNTTLHQLKFADEGFWAGLLSVIRAIRYLPRRSSTHAASTITRPRPRRGFSPTMIRMSRCSAVRNRIKRSTEKSSSRPR